MQDKPSQRRTASCKCGELCLTTIADPVEIYICSCLDCQKLSGSSYTYCAIYPEENVTISGGKTWRYHADSGRWIETIFCATCGCLVGYRLEAFPKTVLISVGCFADPDFPKPQTHYFAQSCHRWLEVPDGIVALDGQNY